MSYIPITNGYITPSNGYYSSSHNMIVKDAKTEPKAFPDVSNSKAEYMHGGGLNEMQNRLKNLKIITPEPTLPPVYSPCLTLPNSGQLYGSRNRNSKFIM